MNVNTFAAARVAKGVKFLDDNTCSCGWGQCEEGSVPNNWRSKIDLDVLSIESTDKCVIGQIFGSYYAGTGKLEVEGLDGGAMGFCGGRDYSTAGDNEYVSDGELDLAWRVALGGVLPVKLGAVYLYKTYKSDGAIVLSEFEDDGVKWVAIKAGEVLGDDITPTSVYRSVMKLSQFNERYELRPSVVIVEGQFYTEADGNVWFAGKDGMAWKLGKEGATWTGYGSLAKKAGLKVYRTLAGRPLGDQGAAPWGDQA